MNRISGSTWCQDIIICRMKPSRAPMDLRRLRRENDRRMLFLVLFVLVGIGTILTAVAYGPGPAAVALLCLMAGAGAIGLLWLIFSVIGRWAGDS